MLTWGCAFQRHELPRFDPVPLPKSTLQTFVKQHDPCLSQAILSLPASHLRDKSHQLCQERRSCPGYNPTQNHGVCAAQSSK